MGGWVLMALSAAQRRASATVKPSRAYPTGRFPVNDTKHARLALQMLPRAKNLSGDEAARIKARATRMLGAQRALKGR